MYHKTCPITFTLVVDNFGVEYVNKDDMDHLIASIKKNYMLTEDWARNLYCGIQLDWDYAGRTVNISMPGYIKKKFQEYRHIMPRKIQGYPYAPEPKKIGTEAQASFPQDNTQKLDKNKGIKWVQNIVGSILYYTQAVDMTVLMALSTIAVDQMKAKKRTMERCMQLLDYLAHNVDAKVRFHASDMILNIHSDASYLSEAKARSRACGHFFMGWMPKNGESIQLNGAFHVNMTIMRFVVASAVEAELGTLYHNFQTGIIFLTHIDRNGTPATPNTSKLQQQCHRSGNCK